MAEAQATNATTPTAAEAEAAVEADQGRIPIAIEKARGALDELKKKLAEYDEQYKASESASTYLKGAIEQAQTQFDKLSTNAAALKDKTAEIPTKAFSSAFAAANVAMERVHSLAAKYDEQFQLSSKVSAAVEAPRQRAISALAEASELSAQVSASANAGLQGVNQGIRQRALSFGSSGAGFIFSSAAALNERFSVEDKAAAAGAVVAEKATALDTRFNVTEKATSLATKGLDMSQGLDTRVTGGRVAPVVASAYEQGLQLAWGGLAFAQAGYESAKQQRSAPAAEGPLLAGSEEPPKTNEAAQPDASEGK